MDTHKSLQRAPAGPRRPGPRPVRIVRHPLMQWAGGTFPAQEPFLTRFGPQDPVRTGECGLHCPNSLTERCPECPRRPPTRSAGDVGIWVTSPAQVGSWRDRDGCVRGEKHRSKDGRDGTSRADLRRRAQGAHLTGPGARFSQRRGGRRGVRQPEPRRLGPSGALPTPRRAGRRHRRCHRGASPRRRARGGGAQPPSPPGRRADHRCPPAVPQGHRPGAAPHRRAGSQPRQAD